MLVNVSTSHQIMGFGRPSERFLINLTPNHQSLFGALRKYFSNITKFKVIVLVFFKILFEQQKNARNYHMYLHLMLTIAGTEAHVIV
jgi:hypothetical protein